MTAGMLECSWRKSAHGTKTCPGLFTSSLRLALRTVAISRLLFYCGLGGCKEIEGPVSHKKLRGTCKYLR